uniref:Uncharacterized protein n=1 Tax=Anguilla anguilla TaxID=7936 RepID=A0A0E9X586_ANGAN
MCCAKVPCSEITIILSTFFRWRALTVLSREKAGEMVLSRDSLYRVRSLTVVLPVSTKGSWC